MNTPPKRPSPRIITSRTEGTDWGAVILGGAFLAIALIALTALALWPDADHVDTIGPVPIYRRKIPSGWLVVTEDGDTVTYVPDPDHAWEENR